ncbi:Uncharacterized protein EbC_27640 [Erwinia billingiae Eb661]|uniref:Uncharacterized protein n=1 Tax=Erwinia billingiae (strain Eb661) TaxID=634500 RepID=D8MTY8_ERWBE|nr:Uncharacterized protein EbC_27640 [Erwinia billingiae Eb661]
MRQENIFAGRGSNGELRQGLTHAASYEAHQPDEKTVNKSYIK